MEENCSQCGNGFNKDDDKYEVWAWEEGKKKLKGYQCLKCNQESIPDEVWEDLDKYHQGI